MRQRPGIANDQQPTWFTPSHRSQNELDTKRGWPPVCSSTRFILRGYCSRFQTKSSLAAANRKWFSGAVLRVTDVIFRWLFNVWGWPVSSDRLHTRDRFGKPLPVCCRHGGKLLEFSSPTGNSRNTSKNPDQRTANRSEIPSLVMIHHVGKRSKTTGLTSPDLLVWSNRK